MREREREKEKDRERKRERERLREIYIGLPIGICYKAERWRERAVTSEDWISRERETRWAGLG